MPLLQPVVVAVLQEVYRYTMAVLLEVYRYTTALLLEVCRCYRYTMALLVILLLPVYRCRCTTAVQVGVRWTLRWPLLRVVQWTR
jgi:hypothetical protein